jgi:hypothetical protein
LGNREWKSAFDDTGMYSVTAHDLRVLASSFPNDDDDDITGGEIETTPAADVVDDNECLAYGPVGGPSNDRSSNRRASTSSLGDWGTADAG